MIGEFSMSCAVVAGFGEGKLNGSHLWRSEAIRKAALILAIGHALNETKSAETCPLAMAEVWACWDPAESAPRQARLELFWGTRPGSPSSDDFKAWGKHGGFAGARSKSAEAWACILKSAGCGNGRAPFSLNGSGERRVGNRMGQERRILVYRDSRCREGIAEPLASKLWRARRSALKEAPGEAASLFSELGKAMACASLPEGSGKLSLDQLRAARRTGQSIAREALGSKETWMRDFERIEFDYDLACRELGQTASEAGSMEEASGMMDGFFSELGQSEIWPLLAGGGEQEAFFPLLCRLEPAIFKLMGDLSNR